MLTAYINYPQPHITFHRDLTCREIEKHTKPNRRRVTVNTDSISEVLSALPEGQEFKFGSSSGINDMWIQIDFPDPDFEEALLRYIQSLLARRHAPFARAEIRSCHCSR